MAKEKSKIAQDMTIAELFDERYGLVLRTIGQNTEQLMNIIKQVEEQENMVMDEYTLRIQQSFDGFKVNCGEFANRVRSAQAQIKEIDIKATLDTLIEDADEYFISFNASLMEIAKEITTAVKEKNPNSPIYLGVQQIGESSAEEKPTVQTLKERKQIFMRHPYKFADFLLGHTSNNHVKRFATGFANSITQAAAKLTLDGRIFNHNELVPGRAVVQVGQIYQEVNGYLWKSIAGVAGGENVKAECFLVLNDRHQFTRSYTKEEGTTPDKLYVGFKANEGVEPMIQ